MERKGAFIHLEPDEAEELGLSTPIHADMIELKAVDDRLLDRADEITMLHAVDDPSWQENGEKMRQIERLERAQRYAVSLSALVTAYQIESLPVTTDLDR